MATILKLTAAEKRALEVIAANGGTDKGLNTRTHKDGVMPLV